MLTVMAEDDTWSAVEAAATGVLGVRRATDGTVRLLPADITLGPEEYVLRREQETTVVRAGSAEGAFRALTRIRRRGHDADPIREAPAHSWRGLMLDTARWFVPLDELIVLIDQLAERRLNVLHLHLTDDQGWRLPVPGWPRLTEVGAWRVGTTTRPAPIEGIPTAQADDDWGYRHRHDGVPHGGHYSPADLKRLVAYAADRFITIVPEVDIPGHVQSAIAAYPHLGVGAPDVPVATRFGISPSLLTPTPDVVRFIEDVLAAVCDIFPGAHVHIGGDEPHLETWRRDPFSTARAAELGLPDTAALRGWFVDVAVSFLRERGRTALYWYDGEVLSDEAIAVSWLADDGGLSAARRGARVITADHTRTYLNYRARDEDPNPYACGIVLEEATAAAFRVVPEAAGDAAGRFLGGQAQLWTEYAPHREARESLLFPRLDLIADALWDGPQQPARDAQSAARCYSDDAYTAVRTTEQE